MIAASPCCVLRRRVFALCGIVALLGAASAVCRGDESPEFFENQVRPLLLAKCAGCHGPEKQENGLRVDARAALLAGGVSGPAIVPGDAEASLLWQAAARSGPLQMPPDEPLSPDEVETLRQWISAGAPWPTDAPVANGQADRAAALAHWSFRPRNWGAWLAGAGPGDPSAKIDALLAGRQRQAGLPPAPAADRATLLRRATYDLTGLPPTADEFTAFLADESPGAFAALVDRLLASPRYGERWGRHWLDVVRYADTAGETADFPAPLAYRYRDYVIRSFNDDKPYDQFLREQVAGDLLAQSGPRIRYAEQVVATGFVAVSRRFGFDSENYHHLTIQDTIDTLGQAVLGLSLGCARCHDHKFDPVTMRDYYALYGIFDSTRYAFPGSEEKKRPRDLVPLAPPAEAAALEAARSQRISALEADLKTLDEQLAAAKTALDQASEPREAAQRKLQHERLTALRAATAAERDVAAETPPYDVAYAVTEGQPHDSPVQLRGDPQRPGDAAPRRWLEVLGGNPLPPDEAGSGRRQLARWLTLPDNPLTARVIVNRVWQQHFGRGLVETVNDFGRRGQPPTHPELLDYLAQRLVSGGWSLKALHREIMLSAAYRRSAHAPAQQAADPDNRLLARFSRRPLSAEELRDTLLACGGTLDLSPAGAHPFPSVCDWNFSQHTPFLAVYPSQRRSVFLMVQRIKRHPYLALFDGADPNASTGARSRSYVPTQALFLLNSSEVHEQSSAAAARLLAVADPHERLSRAWVENLCRLPSDEERDEAQKLLADCRAATVAAGTDDAERQCWAALVRSLWQRTEFLFVE